MVKFSYEHEKGKSYFVRPNADGEFIFSDKFPSKIVRVTLLKKGREIYPENGRLIGVGNRHQKIFFS